MRRARPRPSGCCPADSQLSPAPTPRPGASPWPAARPPAADPDRWPIVAARHSDRRAWQPNSGLKPRDHRRPIGSAQLGRVDQPGRPRARRRAARRSRAGRRRAPRSRRRARRPRRRLHAGLCRARKRPGRDLRARSAGPPGRASRRSRVRSCLAETARTRAGTGRRSHVSRRRAWP